MVKLLFLAGSARKNSINKKLAHAAATLGKTLGAEATIVDLKDYPLPLYDGDFEEQNGLPETAIKLKQLFKEHDGVFIASPEYNSSFSPLLKNTLDWISRKHLPDEPSLQAYKGKVMALAAASPGALGGLRGLVPLRMMLGNIGVTVIPTQAAIGNAGSAFAEDDTLQNPQQAALLESTVAELVSTATALKA